MAGRPGRPRPRARLVDGALRRQPEREADASMVDGHRGPRRHLCPDPAPVRAWSPRRRLARGLWYLGSASPGPGRDDGLALLRRHLPARPAILGIGLLG